MRHQRISLRRATLALISALVSGALVAPGCTFEESSPSGSDEAEGLGAVAMALEIAPGLSLTTVTYEITGNDFRRAGSIDVRQSSTVSAVVGGIPVGTGYIVTLGATGTRDLTCSGSGSFDIVAGAVAQVSVSLVCRLPRQTGSVIIDGVLNVCPLIDDFSIAPASAIVGASIALSGNASDVDMAPSGLTYAWTSTRGTLFQGATPNAGLTCTEPGTAIVTLTVSDGDCTDQVVANVTCTEATGPGVGQIVINEVESNQGTPGDWVELFNVGTGPVDISGWLFRDDQDGRAYTIPFGTVVLPGAYYVLEEAAFGFGLGGNDMARIFRPDGSLVDSYAWSTHAPVTYGRCPNGVGEFTANPISTKGLPNACDVGSTDGGVDGGTDGGTDGGITALPWPGSETVVAVDVPSSFGSNLSGLTYQPASIEGFPVLWAALNGPSKVFRLIRNGANWIPDPNDGWQEGKLLRYPNGTGAPDAEGLTKAAWTGAFVYVATERNNDQSSVSRQSVLMFDTTAIGTELVALREWNLNSDLPVVGANLGLEAITWVPDTFLVANGFLDESTGAPYDPSLYPAHAGGVFFVGVEGTGRIYGFVLDHVGGTFTRVATIANPQPSVMDMEFDRDLGYLWTYCDDTCGNRAAVLALETGEASSDRGRFVVRGYFDRPLGLPNVNNEGFAFAPIAECVDGLRFAFWSDDNQTGGRALREGTLTCGPLF